MGTTILYYIDLANDYFGLLAICGVSLRYLAQLTLTHLRRV